MKDLNKENVDLNSFISNLSDFLKISGSQQLSGGLRCITKEHSISGKVVIKQGDAEEFVRQKDYITNLPEELQALFPKILFLSNVENNGVLVMEQLEGRSLHELLFLPNIPSNNKVNSFNNILNLLTKMHNWKIADSLIPRTIKDYSNKIFKRVTTLDLPEKDKENIKSILISLENTVKDESISASLIHGDAQAGNFIVSSDCTVHKFIDPLGGSGQSPGDWIYDWSRMFHWVNSAGIAYEYENNNSSLFKIRCNEFYKIKEALEFELLTNFKILAHSKNDKSAETWLWIYVAFHLTGKLSNFKSPFSQKILLDKLTESLQKAVNG
jgi:aminoglycoside phosphotransferase